MRLNFIFALVLVSLTAGPVRAKSSDVVCHARVFAVSRELAASLLDNPKLGSDAGAVLSRLQELVAASQAELIPSPAVRTLVPGRVKARGLVALDMEVKAAEAGRLKIVASADQGGGEQRASLLTTTEVELGKSRFLGTLEPQGVAGQNRTWLVFLQVQ